MKTSEQGPATGTARIFDGYHVVPATPGGDATKVISGMKSTLVSAYGHKGNSFTADGSWISPVEFQVVAHASNHLGYKVLSPKDLLHRPDRKKRIHEIERRRAELVPSFRILLGHVSSAEAGVSPAASQIRT